MTGDAAFYFANLGADVSRCASAARQKDTVRYADSLARAHETLKKLRATERPEAYEEALLMLRGLEYARSSPQTLASFQSSLDALIGTFASRFSP